MTAAGVKGKAEKNRRLPAESKTAGHGRQQTARKCETHRLEPAPRWMRTIVGGLRIGRVYQSATGLWGDIGSEKFHLLEKIGGLGLI